MFVFFNFKRKILGGPWAPKCCARLPKGIQRRIFESTGATVQCVRMKTEKIQKKVFCLKWFKMARNGEKPKKKFDFEFFPDFFWISAENFKVEYRSQFFTDLCQNFIMVPPSCCGLMFSYELRWSEHFCFSEIFQNRRLLTNFRELFMLGGDFGAKTSNLSPEVIFWAMPLKMSAWHSHVVARRSVSIILGHPTTFTLAKFFKIGDHLPPEKPQNVNNSLIFLSGGFEFVSKYKI